MNKMFRAWSEKLSKFSEPFTLNSTTINFIYDNGSGLLKPLEDEEVQQYINRKDKNGKSICEGDIVLGYDPFIISDGTDGHEAGRKVYRRGQAQEEPQYDTYVVSYNTELAGYYPFCEPAFGGYEYENLDAEECQIIGNIYENPEIEITIKYTD